MDTRQQIKMTVEELKEVLIVFAEDCYNDKAGAALKAKHFVHRGQKILDLLNPKSEENFLFNSEQEDKRSVATKSNQGGDAGNIKGNEHFKEITLQTNSSLSKEEGKDELGLPESCKDKKRGKNDVCKYPVNSCQLCRR